MAHFAAVLWMQAMKYPEEASKKDAEALERLEMDAVELAELEEMEDDEGDL